MTDATDLESKNSSGDVLDVDPAIVPMGRYKPLQLLGQGALGRVYLCLDKHLRKTVAVKTLLSVTDDRVVSFQNEARIASRLQHESIIQILDFGVTDGGRPFMVMEYFPSQSLDDLLKNEGPLGEGEALDIFILITDALSCLHENGVFHRDLKPSNILVGTDEQGNVSVRVIDFNLSKTSQDIQSKTIVQGRTVVGTPAYMSPDQIAGKKYDAKSEVYSMGCLMYEVLTGETPFVGDNALEILNKHANEELLPPQELLPELSDQLNDIVERCLQKSRNLRYATMNDLIRDLNACARDTAGGAGASQRALRDQKPSRDQRSASGAVNTSSKVVIYAAVAIGLTIIGCAWISMTLMKQPELPKIKFSHDDAPARGLGDSLTDEPSDCATIARDAVKNKIEKVKLPYSCTDEDVKILAGCRSIQELAIFDSLSLTDEVCKTAATMPNLRRLELDGTGVETLEGLGGCRNLDFLSVNRTLLNDQAAKNFKGLDKLFWLRICKAKITNKFFANLPTLPALADITVSGQNITDDCIPDLVRQKHLAYINISGTAITPDGVRKLVSQLKHVMAVDSSDNSTFHAADVAKLTREFPKIDFDPKSALRSLSKTEMKAEELFKDGSYKEALTLYKRCVRMQPRDAKIRIVGYQVRVADCYQHLGNWQEAIKSLMEFGKTAVADGNDSSAIILFDRAAKIAKEQGDTANSIAPAENLRRIYTRKFGPNSDEVFYITLHLGNVHMVRKNFAEAEKLFNQVSEIGRHKHRNPELVRYQVIPLVYRAELLRMQGRKTEAEKGLLESLGLLRAELRLRPSDQVRNVFFNAAAGETQILIEDKKFDEALKLNTEAMRVLRSNTDSEDYQNTILQRQRQAIEALSKQLKTKQHHNKIQ